MLDCISNFVVAIRQNLLHLHFSGHKKTVKKLNYKMKLENAHKKMLMCEIEFTHPVVIFSL